MGTGTPVAVVVPAQDCAGTIVPQLEALRRQECDYPYTVVVADNGSGTAYTAQLLSCLGLGLSTAHERWFRPYPARGDPYGLPRPALREAVSRMREEARRRRYAYEGESSWLAVPRLCRYKVLVLLQVRDPLRVISSFATQRFFSVPEASGSGPWHRSAAAHCPLVGDDLIDRMRWWARCNACAATHAAYVYRIEDLDVAGPRRLLRFLGREVSDDVVHATMAQAHVTGSNKLSTCTETAGYRLSWNDLPRGPEREELLRTAAAFGYEPG